MEPLNPIDSSVKALIREAPEAFLRLVGLLPDAGTFRLEDTAVNVPEQRADHVFVFEKEESADECAVYLEYQLHPDSRRLPEWFAKCGALGKQLGLPVLLLVIYLEKGEYATFPDTYSVAFGDLRNDFRFAALRLWEHADRIRSGELWELAPLLVLCEDNPDERTVLDEVRLIDRADVSAQMKADLLAIALRVAARDLPRPALEAIFRKELAVVQGTSIIDDWIEEAAQKARVEGAQRLTLDLLRGRFGEIPPSLEERVNALDADGCRVLMLRAMQVESWKDLDPS